MHILFNTATSYQQYFREQNKLEVSFATVQIVQQSASDWSGTIVDQLFRYHKQLRRYNDRLIVSGITVLLRFYHGLVKKDFHNLQIKYAQIGLYESSFLQLDYSVELLVDWYRK